MTDLTVIYGFNDFICNRENRSVAKTGRYFVSAIDTGKFLIFAITAKCQCFLNNRSEVFVFTDVNKPRIGNNFGCKNTIHVGCFRRHEAIGCKQYRCRKIIKFLLLILPCSTKVSFQLRIFFQFRICMCREHFAMCINIDSLTCSLVKKCFQIEKVMSADNNKRTFFDCQRNSGWNRCAISFCICLIKKCHTFQIDFSCF